MRHYDGSVFETYKLCKSNIDGMQKANNLMKWLI